MDTARELNALVVEFAPLIGICTLLIGLVGAGFKYLAVRGQERKLSFDEKQALILRGSDAFRAASEKLSPNNDPHTRLAVIFQLFDATLSKAMSIGVTRRLFFSYLRERSKSMSASGTRYGASFDFREPEDLKQILLFLLRYREGFEKTFFRKTLFDFLEVDGIERWNFDGIRFYQCIFYECEFHDIVIRNSEFIGCHFEKCNFRKVKFCDVKVDNCIQFNCNYSDSKLENISFIGGRAVISYFSCSLKRVVLKSIEDSKILLFRMQNNGGVKIDLPASTVIEVDKMSGSELEIEESSQCRLNIIH